MVGFKTWLQNEILAGPGNNWSDEPEDVHALNKEIARKGAGAFPSLGDKPPKPVKTATANYTDPRFARKYMDKDSKKKQRPMKPIK